MHQHDVEQSVEWWGGAALAGCSAAAWRKHAAVFPEMPQAPTSLPCTTAAT